MQGSATNLPYPGYPLSSVVLLRLNDNITIPITSAAGMLATGLFI